mmetsp:Transcript_62653/g.149455  ORF Transcript_62653/g.149455 Transcript_62653/m.149455 type:complete len:95 (-) Transcript_62653:110-394(-)
MGLEEDFNAAAELIAKGKQTKGTATNEDKLALYGLYKQAKEGDNTASAPWAVQLEAKAKWDAWTKHKGKSKEDAMTEYIAEVNRQTELYGVEAP